jgi:hypothetical protein
MLRGFLPYKRILKYPGKKVVSGKRSGLFRLAIIDEEKKVFANIGHRKENSRWLSGTINSFAPAFGVDVIKHFWLF